MPEKPIQTNRNSRIKIILQTIKTFTVFHWIRLGLCSGLLFVIQNMVNIIITGRLLEKMIAVYQLGEIEIERGVSLPQLVYKINADSFFFESILIAIVGYGIWFIILLKFGLPRKIRIFK